uniref:Fructose-1-6-bisphosphatase, N-terminal domain n=1 Tax=Megaviridae environmental sample TaxID=1737588 RepID=A0A5J6VKS6_9VIRU|nr:MAG: fructose-1-6-bisphosphatase, N-terminal domain [Megaviridae environmental sample]
MILENAFIKITDYLRYYDFNQAENVHLLNKSNDKVTNADIFCHDVIKDSIKDINYNIIGFISEESPEIVFIKHHDISKKNYIIAFDPLDGSSNVNFNINSGSIWIIYEYDIHSKCLVDIVKAGYCLYGPSTILVETENDKVKMYTLNKNNKFIFKKNINFNTNLNNTEKIYSINQSNEYDKEVNYLIRSYNTLNYKQRWVGTMVADCHRILTSNGIFIYTNSVKYPEGKIRLYYEGLPFAYIYKLAGGHGLNSGYKDLLNTFNSCKVNNVHITAGIILCSDHEYKKLNNILEFYDID